MDGERWVVFEDAWEAHGFTQIPNAVMRDPELSMPAKGLYGLIKSYAWEDPTAHPGMDRLCRNAGVSYKTLAKWMKELEASGLLEIKRRGQGKTNLYTFRSLSHRYGPEVNQPLHPEVKASLHPHTYAESDTGPILDLDTGPPKEDSVKNTQKLSSFKKEDRSSQHSTVESKKKMAQALMIETAVRLGAAKVQMPGKYRQGHIRSWRSLLDLHLPEGEIEATLQRLVEEWRQGNTIPPSQAHAYSLGDAREPPNSWDIAARRNITTERLNQQRREDDLSEKPKNAD